MDYFERMGRRIDGKERFVPGFLGSKERVRQIADIVGVRTPKVFAMGSIDDLLSRALPAEFVLKPDFASTSIGVKLLRRNDGGFTDLVTGLGVSKSEIEESSKAVSRRYYDGGTHGTFLAEEILRDRDGGTPPQDIRAYAFQGEVGMVLMETHLTNPAKAMYFDGDFLPFPDINDRYGVAEGQGHLEEVVEAHVPPSWRELLNVAKRVSMAMPTAFCRVDMYETSDGVCLGEITFYPGTFITRTRKIMHHAEAERLGRMWGEAEERLRGSHEIKFGSHIRDVPSSTDH